MRIAAIIAEYNPFHNGHACQIRRARELTGADHILVIMSGDFVQRGAPAVIDKYSRAEMALCGGADAVLEIPVRYACGSAEFFAAGAVSILDALGCVDYLCFGCENADLLVDMKEIAYTLNHPTDAFNSMLQDSLRQGFSWPQARMRALKQTLRPICTDPERPSAVSETFASTVAGEISAPNNLLAVEYLRALDRLNSSIIPVSIQREGAGYHDTALQSSSGENGAYDSASAIRKELLNCGCSSRIHGSVPAETMQILTQQYGKTCPVTANDFSLILHYLLLNKTAEELCEYQDITPDLANKVVRSRNDFQNFDQFCMLLKSRDLTYSRISRSLMHLILGIRKMSSHEIKPDYARLLGFCKDSSALLSEIKEGSSIPLITRAAGFHDDSKSFKEDLFAADLYSSIAAQKFGCGYKNEYQRQIIIKRTI